MRKCHRLASGLGSNGDRLHTQLNPSRIIKRVTTVNATFPLRTPKNSRGGKLIAGGGLTREQRRFTKAKVRDAREVIAIIDGVESEPEVPEELELESDSDDDDTWLFDLATTHGLTLQTVWSEWREFEDDAPGHEWPDDAIYGTEPFTLTATTNATPQTAGQSQHDTIDRQKAPLGQSQPDTPATPKPDPQGFWQAVAAHYSTTGQGYGQGKGLYDGPKRPRGRPRKVVEPPDPDAAKRPRGRPRKYPLPPVGDLAPSVLSALAPSPDSE